WQEIFGTIRKNKLRTFLTALGVFWGIFMLIVLMGAGTGLQNGVYAMFGNIAKNSMFVGANRTTMPFEGLPHGRVPKLEDADLRAIQEEFADKIDILTPIMWIETGEIARKGLSGAFDVQGIAPEMLSVDERDMAEGRFINQKDMEEKRKVVVIGQRVRSQIFKKEESVIGERLKIKGSEYLVVGVFKVISDSGNSDDTENGILMPFTTAQRVNNLPNRVSMFMCTMREENSAAIFEPQLLALLKERHRVHPDDPRGFWCNNIEEEFMSVANLFTGIKLLIWFVGIGSLLFGILGVGNIMVIVVKDRTKEIGIRKALGATPRSIISMILMESAFITTIAGYLGLVFSIGMVALMKAAVGKGVSMFKDPEIDLGVAIGATLVLIIAGTLTGLIPAMQAANVNPVDALKDE
ncbi:MAG: putative ABC transport system permease protein, partial [Saprospiraceae bacterium]